MNAKQIYHQAYSDRRAVKVHKMDAATFEHKYCQSEQLARISVKAVASFVQARRYGVK